MQRPWQCSAGKRVIACALLQVTGWFTEKLNYEYDPLVHGNTAEWLSDLVSISFDEPPKYFKRSMRCLKVTPILCLAHHCAFLACRESGSTHASARSPLLASALPCMAYERHVSVCSGITM